MSRSSNKAAPYEILKGINLPFSTPANALSQFSPTNSFPLLKGTVTGYPPEPVAWVHRTPAKGKVFYTSLGIRRTLKRAFNQLLKMPSNGVWAKMIASSTLVVPPGFIFDHEDCFCFNRCIPSGDIWGCPKISLPVIPGELATDITTV